MSKEWVDELMQLICARDLTLENIRAAQELKQRHFPASLYKYRAVNDYSLSNLRNASLHLTCARNFNDPYDSAMVFDPFFGTTPVEQLIEGVLVDADDDRRAILASEYPLLELLRHQNSLTDAARQLSEEGLAQLAEVLEARHAKFAAHTISSMNSRIQESYKICSVSERLDSLPLWAHYANNHTGFAMEYDFRSLPPNNLLGLSLWPVRYSGLFDASEILRGIAPRRKSFNNLYALIAALHKSPDWAYEEEWRLVLIDSPNDPPRDVFAPLKSVYLGSQMAKQDEDAVVQNAHIAGVPVFKMSFVPHEFRMEAVPL